MEKKIPKNDSLNENYVICEHYDNVFSEDFYRKNIKDEKLRILLERYDAKNTLSYYSESAVAISLAKELNADILTYDGGESIFRIHNNSFEILYDGKKNVENLSSSLHNTAYLKESEEAAAKNLKIALLSYKCLERIFKDKEVSDLDRVKIYLSSSRLKLFAVIMLEFFNKKYNMSYEEAISIAKSQLYLLKRKKEYAVKEDIMKNFKLTFYPVYEFLKKRKSESEENDGMFDFSCVDFMLNKVSLKKYIKELYDDCQIKEKQSEAVMINIAHEDSYATTILGYAMLKLDTYLYEKEKFQKREYKILINNGFEIDRLLIDYYKLIDEVRKDKDMSKVLKIDVYRNNRENFFNAIRTSSLYLNAIFEESLTFPPLILNKFADNKKSDLKESFDYAEKFTQIIRGIIVSYGIKEEISGFDIEKISSKIQDIFYK